MNPAIKTGVCIGLLLAASATAEPAHGKKAARKPSHADGTLKKAKGSVNHALDGVDHAVHRDADAAQKGSNRALQAVDDTIHGRKTSGSRRSGGSSVGKDER